MAGTNRQLTKIDLMAKESMLLKDAVVKLANQAVSGLGSLISEMKSEPDIDRRDVETARYRLAELKAAPESLVRGSALRRRLERFET